MGRRMAEIPKRLNSLVLANDAGCAKLPARVHIDARTLAYPQPPVHKGDARWSTARELCSAHPWHHVVFVGRTQQPNRSHDPVD